MKGSGSEKPCPDRPFAPSWASAPAAGSPCPTILTFPKARSTESKYKSIPKRMKKRPKPTSPTPIPAEDGRRAETGAQAHSSGPTLACSCSSRHRPGLFPPRNVLWICLQNLETAFPPAQALGRLLGTPETPLGCQIKNRPQRKNKQEGHLQHFSE